MKNILAGEKKYNEGYELLSSLFEIDRKTYNNEVKETLNYITSRTGDQFSCMYFLYSDYSRLSSVNLLIEKNIEEHRLNCYIAGKLRILSTGRSSMLVTSPTQMFEMFMSNNPDFITFFKNNIDMIMPDDYDSEKNKYGYLKNDYGTFFLIRVILHAIRGDFEEVKKRCTAYLEKPLKDSYYKYGEIFRCSGR